MTEDSVYRAIVEAFVFENQYSQDMESKDLDYWSWKQQQEHVYVQLLGDKDHTERNNILDK